MLEFPEQGLGIEIAYTFTHIQKKEIKIKYPYLLYCFNLILFIRENAHNTILFIEELVCIFNTANFYNRLLIFFCPFVIHTVVSLLLDRRPKNKTEKIQFKFYLDKKGHAYRHA